MTDSELNRMLKAASEPKLDDDYLKDLPRLVFARLRATSVRRRTAVSWWPQLAWSGGIAFACAIMVLALGYRHELAESKTAGANDIIASARLVHETLTMFPHQVRAIVRDKQGIHLVLSEESDVPVSTPLYVRICDGKQCASIVTFSGQEFHAAGRDMTVLSDAQGGIIVMGKDFAWSSRHEASVRNDLTIQARNLDQAAM